jgi:Zn-dependent protease
MPANAWPVPFILTPQTLQVDAVATFAVSILLTTMVNAEAQAFAATILGDYRQNPKDRFNFNVFLHLDILGTLCYLVGGFGWARKLEVDPGKFKRPQTDLVLTRAAGPVANLLLASIGGSLAWLIGKFDYDPRVFLMIVGVNVTTAVYNLIILPPLAGGVLVRELIPPRYATVRQIFSLAGPYLVLALALLERLSLHGLVSPYLNPIVLAIYEFIRKG